MSLLLKPDSVAVFQKEWEPLGVSLKPVEYLGKGLFACEHQPNSIGPKPVVIWDTMADLAEQTMIKLAENLSAYEALRKSGNNPSEETLSERRRWKRKAEVELIKAIEEFNRFAEGFHHEYQAQQAFTGADGTDDGGISTFEHDKVNRPPRYDAWKPERFCVHDHLMGVMGYRFNRTVDRLEVAGYATRDHTNYARGSATRSLLLCLLCEWAKQSVQKGIVFVDEWHKSKPDPVVVPYEISLYGRVLGVDIKPGERELPYLACETLFLKLTPFSLQAREMLEKSDLSIKACLIAHKGIWSIPQIEDLVRYCPMAQEIFEGSIQPEEQVRMAMAMEHAKLAVMAGIAEQMIRVQAEDKQASVKVHGFESGLSDWPYSRLLSCGCDILFSCLENGQRIERNFEAGVLFAIFSWPVTEQLFHRGVKQMFKALQKTAHENNLNAVVLLVPEQAVLNQSVSVPDHPGIHLALMHETLDVIRQTAWRNIQQAGRLRK